MTLALQRLSSLDVAALPVLDADHGMQVVGMLGRRDVIAAHQRIRAQRPEVVARIDRLQGSVPGARVFEVVVHPDSPAANQEVRSLSLPPDSIFVAVRRHERTLIPRGDTVLQPGDRVIALTDRERLSELQKVFSKPSRQE